MNFVLPKFRLRICRSFLVFFAPLFLVFQTNFASAQPIKNWDKTLGGTSYEELNALLTLSDGIIAAGSTQSNASFGNAADTSWNFLIYKLDFDGNVLWQQFFPTEKTDRLWTMTQTSDGGFLAGGYSYSNKGAFKTDDNRGDMDVWLLKLDKNGQKIWDKTFGGTDRDEIFSILEMPNHDGFLLGGHSKSNRGFEKTEDQRGQQDFWILKIDNSGNVIWDKTIGGAGREQFHDMVFAPDGNVLMVGTTASTPNSGELSSDFARGGQDFWLVKMNPTTGQLIWNHRFGGTSEDVAYSILVLKNGQILLGGRSSSNSAPPTTANNGKDAMFYGGASDFWLVKTDADGKKLKDWSLGGDGLDDLYFMQEDLLGNIFLGGVSDSDKSGTKTSNGKGGYDIWLISLDKNGEKRWERTVGGTKSDALTKITTCPGGGIILGGHSMSDVGFDKSENSKGVNDFWIVNYCCDLKPDIQKFGDSIPCSNEPLTLSAKTVGCDSCIYFWNNGEIGKSIEILPGTTDTFSVFAVSRDGCYAHDSLFVDIPEPVIIDFGLRDTSLLEYQSIVIGGNNPDLQYKWNTGDTSATIVVSYGGVYSVTVTDPSGCTARDWMNVKVVQREHIWVPNIFTPNFDGFNDVINVYGDKSVKKIHFFSIADRWGTVYFTRKDFQPNYETDGWDGTFRGGRVPPGVYTWIARIEFLDGKKEIIGGTVYLKR